MVAARFLKLRRLCGPPSRSEQVIVLDQATTREVAHVRSGSLADICSAKGHVRFAPNSDRKSGFPQTAMSALPLKADMCGALAHVCYGPKADMRLYSIIPLVRAKPYLE
jgi:hypothetical protein